MSMRQQFIAAWATGQMRSASCGIGSREELEAEAEAAMEDIEIEAGNAAVRFAQTPALHTHITPAVAEGEEVRAGQVIGYMGGTGSVTVAPVQGGATEEQIEAAAEALREDALLCHVDGSAVPWKDLARAVLSASASADPADDDHDAEEREAELRDSIARDIWADEQECQKAIRQDPTNPHLNGKLSGLQRARDITHGVLVRKAESEDHVATVAGDREKLITEADGWVNADLVHRHAMSALDTIRRLRDALAAPVEVDEAKLAEVLMGHEFNALGQCTCGHSTPDYGSGNRRRVYEKRHFGGVIAEWLRGEGR